MKYKNLYTIRGLGNRKLSNEELRLMFAFVSDRYERMKPTVYTSKYPAKELVSRMCESKDGEVLAYAIVNRLVEMRVEAAV